MLHAFKVFFILVIRLTHRLFRLLSMKPFLQVSILLLLACTSVWAQIEPNAGNWATWTIVSGKKFRLPPPPDKKATQAELNELLSLQGKPHTQATKHINYWNAGAPGYRWGELTSQLSSGGMPPFRALALIHMAIYDATIAAWDTKYIYNRPRPSRASAQIKPLVAIPDSPSYPCEHSVAAGAAATVLAYLFPQKADSIEKLALEAGQSRLLAGVQYPSDVEAGLALGRKVGQLVIDRARKDGSDGIWQGSVPTKAGLWNGTNPVGAACGTWKTLVLDSSSQFRPLPPPDFAKDMEELKNYTPTVQAKARAFYYASQDFWSQITDEKIFEYQLDTNFPRAARVYALKSIAAYDAFLACWEAKYFYWGIRPYQYDPTFKPVLVTPPFPGYPSGHATTSNAVATTLAYLFPEDSTFFYEKARECAQSRFEGGIHFRSDNEAGLEMGHKVGEWVVRSAKSDHADR